MYLASDDAASADAAADEMLNVFASNQKLPEEIFTVARKYSESKKPDEAIAL